MFSNKFKQPISRLLLNLQSRLLSVFLKEFSLWVVYGNLNLIIRLVIYVGVDKSVKNFGIKGRFGSELINKGKFLLKI